MRILYQNIQITLVFLPMKLFKVKFKIIYIKLIYKYINMDLLKINFVIGILMNYINNSNIEELKNNELLEKLIIKLGFNSKNLKNQPEFIKDNSCGLFIWETPNQISKYLTLLSKQNITSYLNIGSELGLTFILTNEYLKKFNKMEKSIAVDSIDSPISNYFSINKETQFIKNSSKNVEFKNYIQDNIFELIFINSNQSYDDLKNYYDICRNHGQIFVFNNIVNKLSPDSIKFWNDLKINESEQYDFFEFTEHHEDEDNDENDENEIKTILGIGVAIKKKPRVCFITAVYGSYESSCKKFANQIIPTDFICFTDNKNITKNDWIIDNTPYHLENKSPVDNNNYVNSINNNKHTFNIAKYYKQSFQNIPRLKKYDVIIWLDGTIEITYKKTSKYILENIYEHKIITWHHEYRNGILLQEVVESNMYRYTTTFWNNQEQPYQDVNKQYVEYLNNGYNETFFKNMNSHTPNFGVWITCFIAFLNNDKPISDFLNMWYLQTLKYTTQDQIGFPYVVQKTKIIPYTLPNNEINGPCPHDKTQFYIKHEHGK